MIVVEDARKVVEEAEKSGEMKTGEDEAQEELLPPQLSPLQQQLQFPAAPPPAWRPPAPAELENDEGDSGRGAWGNKKWPGDLL